MKIAFDLLLFFSFLTTLLQLYSAEWAHVVQKEEMMPTTSKKSFSDFFHEGFGNDYVKPQER